MLRQIGNRSQLNSIILAASDGRSTVLSGCDNFLAVPERAASETLIETGVNHLLTVSRKVNNYEISVGSMIAISGMGTMNLPPHVPTWRICATISCFRFQGRIKM